eukprot:g3505.t1
MSGTNTHDAVSDYYSTVLKKSDDLATNACTTSGTPPLHILKALKNIHPDVTSKYYGCGLCVPEGSLEGLTVLDLGCGSGRDVYLLSQFVGPTGKVIGVDMTEEQIDVARRTAEHHMQAFGFPVGTMNVFFEKGYIEKLDEIETLQHLKGKIDIIVSNCVINLSPDKRAVLSQAFELLKPGGELYFSDVYSDRRVPETLRKDKVLWGECISGALYWNDFLNLAKAVGFGDPRLVGDSEIELGNEKLKEKCGNIRFFSATYRLWKIKGLESHCEDYGQAVIYQGGIPRNEDSFLLDSHHRIEKGRIFPVCGNTWRMLKETRFAKYFQFIGNFDTHYGIYADCGTTVPFTSYTTNKESGTKTGGGCC